ncbi:DUF924 family protein [Rhizobium sp. G21]|uniref:DUF924 family protein n=1 Tax=Rhizobium sp. G21 TaxID=2758439 RepID=UPI001602853E|nr:DUF924 family protein [Rhizobium sp. G21]MBB1248024.1 DUF924 domain-containing protein [Rhizobium sp. G21]
MEEKWFNGGAAFDEELESRFAALHDQACTGRLDAWTQSPKGALAMIILLDQLSRNLHRGTPRAFAEDRKALSLALEALEKGWDHEFPDRERQFFYLPLMHSEDPDHQQTCVALYEAIDNENALKFAREHLDIIERFGRFPHRNDVLGRESTDEEEEFLKQHKGF